MPSKLQKYLQKRQCELINMRTKKHYYFEVLSLADAYLGRQPGYVARQYAQKKPAQDSRYIDSFVIKLSSPKLTRKERLHFNGSFKSTQLCWNCKNACGKCSWSQNFTPVAGWGAQKTIINTEGTNGTNKKHYHRTIESYDIKACPLFERG